MIEKKAAVTHNLAKSKLLLISAGAPNKLSYDPYNNNTVFSADFQVMVHMYTFKVTCIIKNFLGKIMRAMRGLTIFGRKSENFVIFEKILLL